jgi:pimeloyl-ACP methyl ester carboxylesterase
MSVHEVVERSIPVEGRPVRVLERGEGPDAVVLLHGGQAGRTPYVGCADLWRPLIDALGEVPRTVAIDLPGCGGSGLGDPRGLLVAATAQRVGATLRELGLERVVVVGHGEASLVALLLAREAPEGVEVGGAMVISGLGAAPTGDALSNLTLLHPPPPRWSEGSQRWALGRICARIDHVTPELVQTLAGHAAGPPHAEAVAAQADPALALDREADLLGARAALFAHARDVGYAVPLSLVWGARDPIAPLPLGHGLFEILATSPAHLNFNVVNETGHLAFREDPRAVARLLAPFALRCLETAVAV